MLTKLQSKAYQHQMLQYFPRQQDVLEEKKKFPKITFKMQTIQLHMMVILKNEKLKSSQNCDSASNAGGTDIRTKYV